MTGRYRVGVVSVYMIYDCVDHGPTMCFFVARVATADGSDRLNRVLNLEWF